MEQPPAEPSYLESALASGALRGRHFLKELDFDPGEWHALLALATELKRERRAGAERRRLSGRNVALLFEKTSTRTRCAFEVAAHQQGAHVTYLDPSGSQLGHKESVEDTGRVLGRMFDGIEFRGSAQEDVEELARVAGVPVWNGLTDEWHPTQSLCDALTMLEHGGGRRGEEISFAYCGDARSNVGNSLLIAGALMGMDVRIVAPASLWNDEVVIAAARGVAERTGARLTHTEDLREGVSGVDFIHTDVWVSMGEPDEIWRERARLLLPYRVDRELLSLSGNPDVCFMHCLPAYHDDRTAVGRRIAELTGISGGLEVTDEVFESPHSIVFDQAENRLHTIKAVMVATLGDAA